MKLAPTKQLLGYIIMLFVAAIPAVFVNSPFGYLPALVLLMFGILSAGQLFLVRKNLRIGNTVMAGQRVRNDTADFSIEIENRGVLPIPNLSLVFYVQNIQGNNRHVYPLSLTMSPKEKRRFGLEADFSHIGIFEVGFEEIALYDLLGIFRVEYPKEAPGRVDVLPCQYRFFEFPVVRNTMADSNVARVPVSIIGSDYAGVREYVYGDPMKTIQWKLSAHAMALMTKQMEFYTNVGLAAVLDFRLPAGEEEAGLSLLDGVVEVGAALAEYAGRKGMDFELLFCGSAGKQKEMPHDAKDFGAFLNELHPDDRDGHTPTRILREECSQMYGQPNVVFCTAFPDEEAAAALVDLKRFGKNPMMLLLLPDELTDEERGNRLAPLRVLQRERIGVLAAPTAERMVKA